MRPLARRRFAWWHSFVSALLVLGVLAAIGAVVLLAEMFGARAIRPLVAVVAILLAVTAQSNRARLFFAFLGGALVRG